MATGNGLIRELALGELRERTLRRAEFMSLHDFWIQRGITRWLALLAPESTRPVTVLGAFEPASDELIGVVVAVWSQMASSLFDNLIETDCRQQATARPRDGVWHIISVTTLEELQGCGLGMGRLLLARMLGHLGSLGHRYACALTPAFGLPELKRCWSGTTEDALMHSSREDGRPVLPVMRLHMGGGARLERLLRDSRQDDEASGHMSLRFGYSTDIKARAQQKERWLRWIASRVERLTLVSEEFDNQALFRATPSHDPLVWDGVVNG